MRRTTAAVLLILGTTLAGLPGLPGLPSSAAPAAATTAAPAAAPTADPGAPSPGAARAALARAAQLLTPRETSPRPSRPLPRVDASLVLRDLALAVPALTGADRSRAEALLARPTDGARDPVGFGYSTGAVHRCSKQLCLHWVTSTGDQPPSEDWVNTSLKVMKRVWRHEVGKLGYRKPVSDRKRGPRRGKFDVYLKELGSARLYGYCAAEPRRSRRSPGYCVLDNDFAESQFGAPPMKSLKVTAAHEFFHAIQFGYDVTEDRWLMEATATWIEERFADGVNDNRQYLLSGQLGKPGSSLDRFSSESGNQYGNWPFVEYLSTRRGNDVVKKLWTRVQATRRSNPYSVQALRGMLGGRGFVRTFAAYSAANTAPRRFYPEGEKWPAAPLADSWRIGKESRRASQSVTIDHLASRSVRARPGGELTGKRWRLRIGVNGPKRASSPAAYVTVLRRKGRTQQVMVKLSRRGDGRTTVPFRRGKVRHVTVTLVNASTRYRCGRGGSRYACHGVPRDQGKRFSVTVKAVKRR